MKKLILAIAIAVTLTGCTTWQSALDARRAEISWSSFCAARGCAPDDTTPETVNDYLDTWCGSADEETALAAAGIKPY